MYNDGFLVARQSDDTKSKNNNNQLEISRPAVLATVIPSGYSLGS